MTAHTRYNFCRTSELSSTENAAVRRLVQGAFQRVVATGGQSLGEVCQSCVKLPYIHQQIFVMYVLKRIRDIIQILISSCHRHSYGPAHKHCCQPTTLLVSLQVPLLWDY